MFLALALALVAQAGALSWSRARLNPGHVSVAFPHAHARHALHASRLDSFGALQPPVHPAVHLEVSSLVTPITDPAPAPNPLTDTNSPAVQALAAVGLVPAIVIKGGAASGPEADEKQQLMKTIANIFATEPDSAATKKGENQMDIAVLDPGTDQLECADCASQEPPTSQDNATDTDEVKTELEEKADRLLEDLQINMPRSEVKLLHVVEKLEGLNELEDEDADPAAEKADEEKKDDKKNPQQQQQQQQQQQKQQQQQQQQQQPPQKQQQQQQIQNTPKTVNSGKALQELLPNASGGGSSQPAAQSGGAATPNA